MNITWYIATAEEGIHITRPSYSECRRWIARHAPILSVLRHLPGMYDVVSEARTWLVVRKDMLAAAGLDPNKWA